MSQARVYSLLKKKGGLSSAEIHRKIRNISLGSVRTNLCKLVNSGFIERDGDISNHRTPIRYYIKRRKGR